MGDEVWLFDRDRQLIAVMPEYDGLVCTLRMVEHSDFDGRFPIDTLASWQAAHFVQVSGDDELYLVERVSDTPQGVVAKGRSATAMLGRRAMSGVHYWSSYKMPAFVDSALSWLTSEGRGIEGLVMGEGSTLGEYEPFSFVPTGPLDTALIAGLGADGTLGWRARLDPSGNVALDFYTLATSATLVGERYGNGSLVLSVTDATALANFAYVEGEPDASGNRIIVEVDDSSGNERREVYLKLTDQRTTDSGELTEEQYTSVLTARGTEELARRATYERVDAEATAALSPGDLVWYDSGRWTTQLAVTEAVVTRQRGATTVRVRLAVPGAQRRGSGGGVGIMPLPGHGDIWF